ncbi:glycosyltransferase family 4 protein [uncultured Tateyamaria sp.]|uniref:glycosyltransferase family 4 protein n=1 Tax=uncultured Tateyamaria sp. TaxID=455651 RepID=UPI00262FF5F1|nr:glycosyltransferase family 4 protein [uncultured Tateyamaria sp.]
MFNAVSPGPVEVCFYPDYRDFNPYQDLLYRSLGPSVIATPLASVADLGSRAISSHVLHLHWETAAISSGAMTAQGLLDALSAFRDRGGRIVWTMHNLMPHNPRERAAAAQIRNGLLALADVVHVHSLPALAAAMAHHTLPLAKVRIIAHGNYDGVYPVVPRATARTALGLDGARMVVLLAGQMRAYKSPGALVEAFQQVGGADDRLILAGHRASDVKDLSIPDDPRIMSRMEFLDADDLAQVHGAADVVVLPYTDSLTSGSAILAQTLGRGVLGTDTPGLRDVVAMPTTGVLFDGDELADALRNALAEGPAVWAARGKAAARASRARDWTVLGASWRALFTELAASPRSDRVIEP